MLKMNTDSDIAISKSFFFCGEGEGGEGGRWEDIYLSGKVDERSDCKLRFFNLSAISGLSVLVTYTRFRMHALTKKIVTIKVEGIQPVWAYILYLFLIRHCLRISSKWFLLNSSVITLLPFNITQNRRVGDEM